MATDTKSKGDRTEGIFLAEMLKKSIPVLLPFGDNQRYDLVIDVGGQLLKIQCKTGRFRDGVIMFNTCSSHAHRGGGSRSYRGDIDYFGVHCPYNDSVYMIPVENAPLRRMSMRLEAPKNNQKTGIHYAVRYELEKTLLSIRSL